MLELRGCHHRLLVGFNSRSWQGNEAMLRLGKSDKMEGAASCPKEADSVLLQERHVDGGRIQGILTLKPNTGSLKMWIGAEKSLPQILDDTH